MNMDDSPPEPTPDSPPPQPPDGWEILCIGIMRGRFGRRRSEALKKAMMQLSAEQAWIEGRAEAARMSWWKRISEVFTGPGMRLAFAAAMVLLLGVLMWEMFRSPNQANQAVVIEVSGCRIADAVNAHWSGSAAKLKTGDRLPAGILRLDSGVVELAFASGAKAAVEGPAELSLIDRNSLELKRGKLSAEVPKPAIGFTVRTPNATVTDLGTRFGLNTKTPASSEVDVFEGKVRVTEAGDVKTSDNEWNLTRNMAMVLDARGGVTTTAAAETAFPQPGHSIQIRPVNCGFDAPGSSRIGGLPTAFGFWSGPAFGMTGAVAGVRPAQGAGMLRFLAPPRQGGPAQDSVVWQVVDFRPAKEFMAAYGKTDLKAWVQFNRVPGDAHTASKFRLTMAAFHGEPADAAALWASRKQTALAYAEKELVADNDPRTWERVDLATTVSSDADFGVVEIRAIAPADVPPGIDPFPGHFADLIDAKICLPLRPSTLTNAH